MTIGGSVLALFLMCLRYTVLRKMPSTVYYYAWLLVFMRLALPFPGLVPTMGETPTAEPVPAVTAAYSESYVQDNNGYVYETGHNDVVKSVAAESDITINEEKTQDRIVSEPAPKAAFSIDWKSPAIWLSVWALGAFVSMGITVFSYLHFSFSLKKSLWNPTALPKRFMLRSGAESLNSIFQIQHVHPCC